MDKLKSVAQTASEASTLGWGMMGFIACSVVAAVCLVLGVYMLSVPLIGLTLFTVFYTLGNICAVCSTTFLMEPHRQLMMMFHKTRARATTIMITCLVLTLCAAFWWKSVGLALFFCILQVLSFIWYCLSYIPNRREAVMKTVENCSKILSDSIQFLMGPVKLLKWMYEKSPALAVITGLVSTLCAAFLWLSFGLGLLLFGALGVLLCTRIIQSSIPFVREAVMKMVENCSKILSDSIQFLTEPVKLLKWMYEKSPALAVITGLVSTLCAAFLWLSFGLGLLLFGALGVLLCTGIIQSSIPSVGEAVMKMVETCSKFFSNNNNILTRLLKQLKSVCDELTALAVSVALVSILCAALLGSGFGLALLIGTLGGLLLYWVLSYFTNFLIRLLKLLTWMWDKARELAIIICLLLTLLAAFWWRRVGLALLYYVLTVVLFIW